MTLSERARECAKCGYQWIKQNNQPEPKRCPNPKCRTTKWKIPVQEDDYVE